ncbi:hypothetical protein STEG23_033712, partial [Scotinomys teguina]
EWISKMWYIYTMEYYAAEKNNDIMKFAGKWMELENVILSEANFQHNQVNEHRWLHIIGQMHLRPCLVDMPLLQGFLSLRLALPAASPEHSCFGNTRGCSLTAADREKLQRSWGKVRVQLDPFNSSHVPRVELNVWSGPLNDTVDLMSPSSHVPVAFWSSVLPE